MGLGSLAWVPWLRYPGFGTLTTRNLEIGGLGTLGWLGRQVDGTPVRGSPDGRLDQIRGPVLGN